MSKIYFASFSGSVDGDDTDLHARQALLNKSAVELCDAEQAFSWTREDLLASTYYQQHRAVLDTPRGAGFWAWKPWAILQSLDRIGANDWLVYSDVGKPFRRCDDSRAGNGKIGNVMQTPFKPMIRFAQQHLGFTPGIWIPHYGPAKMWAKRDCFVGMGCDTEEYHNSGHVQAGYNVWSNTPEARAFLEEWLRWCQVEAVITDQVNIYGKPNFPEFRDHRHDQAIMTNMVIKHGVELFGPRSKSLGGYREFNLILRHMWLADELQYKANAFAQLFNGSRPYILPALKEALSLLVLPALERCAQVWAYSGGVHETWSKAFAGYELRHDSKLLKDQDTWPHEAYGAIFANRFTHESDLYQQIPKIFDALAPGGVMLVGPFSGTTSDQPKLDGSVHQLLRWIDVNQTMPYSANEVYQQRNGITLGNSVNPLIALGERSYAIIRKPLMVLV